MKKFIITILILVPLILICSLYKNKIIEYTIEFINQNLTVPAPEIDPKVKELNNFQFVQITDQMHVKDKQNILNAIYTILNSGQEEYTFYCDITYKDCKKDIQNISEDQTLLSTINNMVSPYNSYQKLFITIDPYGKATIKVDKLYTKEEIITLNNKINEINNKIIKDNMNNRSKIKAFHDYLINNTTYDEQRANEIKEGSQNQPLHNSHKANGPLLEGWALCSGYSDAMKIYLDQLELPNYKISTNNHIWNLVYIDGKWLHIDLTWDDPVTSNKSNILLDKFFLIDTNKLLSYDTSNHTFNREYYSEA